MRLLHLLTIVLLLALGSTNGYADEDTLIMGVFPRHKATTTYKFFTPLAEYLGTVLGKKVILETTGDYSSFAAALDAGRYAIVHFNQYHYVRYHKTHQYQVIAKNEEFGKSSIASAIVVRKQSDVKTIDDLRNGKIVFGGGQDAMMSYIVPTFLLRQAGLKKGTYTEEFARSPMNAFLAVHFNHARAAGIGDAVLTLPAIQQKYNTQDIEEILVSEPLAHLPWAVNGKMQKELVSKIKLALIGLKQSAEGRAILENANLTGILPAVDAEYDRHREIIREVSGEAY